MKDAIVIMTPVGGGLHPLTVHSLLEMTHSDLFASTWWAEKSIDLPANRNTLLHAAIQDERFRYGLFLDQDNWTDDINVERALEKLKSVGATVLGGIYKVRSSPWNRTLVGGQIEGGKELFVDMLAKCKETVIKADRLNGGAMLIDLSWFRKNWSKGPWFKFLNDKKTYKFLGTEDYYFSDQLRYREAELFLYKWWILGHDLPGGDIESIIQEMEHHANAD